MSAHDAHYGGNLVDGARMLALFGDVATELLIRMDGDEGLFVALRQRRVSRAGLCRRLHRSGRPHRRTSATTSRRMEFEARKVIAARPDLERERRRRRSTEPVVVCRASGTCVTPKAKQRAANHRFAKERP